MKNLVCAVVILSASAVTATAGGASISGSTDFKGNSTLTVTIDVIRW